MRPAIFLLALSLCADVSAAAARSNAARLSFVRLHPCPATGQARLPCPGYQIDHVIPLKCNGADHPDNMQWLTIKAHKQKTKREAKLCRAKPRKARQARFREFYGGLSGVNTLSLPAPRSSILARLCGSNSTGADACREIGNGSTGRVRS